MSIEKWDEFDLSDQPTTLEEMDQLVVKLKELQAVADEAEEVAKAAKA